MNLGVLTTARAEGFEYAEANVFVSLEDHSCQIWSERRAVLEPSKCSEVQETWFIGSHMRVFD